MFEKTGTLFSKKVIPQRLKTVNFSKSIKYQKTTFLSFFFFLIVYYILTTNRSMKLDFAHHTYSFDLSD